MSLCSTPASVCETPVAVTSKRQSNWTEHEVLVLIHVRTEFLDELRSNKRNKNIYKKIATKLSSAADCRERSNEEIKNKIANSTRDYRREKSRMVSGASPSTWNFFKPMNVLLGGLPANNDDLLEDLLTLAIQNAEMVFEDDSSLPEMEETREESNTCSSFSSRPGTSLGLDDSSDAASLGLGVPNRRRPQKRQVSDKLTTIMKEMLSELKRPNKEAEKADERAHKLLEDDAKNQTDFQRNITNLPTHILNK